MDFTWYYFIGKTKLNLTFKETGRLTLRLFTQLYQHYKDTFDLEMRLQKANMTYQKAYEKSQESDKWF